MLLKTKKSVIVGHGINTAQFRPDESKSARNLLLTVGRITRSKRLEVVFRALRRVPEQYVCMVIGPVITKDDECYHKELEKLLVEQNLSSRVVFRSVAQDEIVSFLQSVACLLHASETSLDKAVLEAMACGCPVISTNPAAKEVLPRICHTEDETMGEVLERILNLSDEELRELSNDLHERVVRDHSLPRLIDRILAEMK